MTVDPHTDIGPDTTVNDLLVILPEASALLSDHGLDTCCGGSLTLAESCSDAGIDVNTVLTELGNLGERVA